MAIRSWHVDEQGGRELAICQTFLPSDPGNVWVFLLVCILDEYLDQ